MSAPAEFRERYEAAFARHVGAPGEGSLSAAYDLGRSAVRSGLSVLDLATVQHDTLLAATTRAGSDKNALVRAGGEFFLEAVSAFEMLERVLRQDREAAAVERRQAVVLRQLSSFLADASIALDASSSLTEMLQLVAEHAREVIGAARCVVELAPEHDQPVLQAEARADDARPPGGSGEDEDAGLAAALTALDGREIGAIRLWGKHDGDFGPLDEAVLLQLAQMASAAVERAQLYRR